MTWWAPGVTWPAPGMTVISCHCGNAYLQETGCSTLPPNVVVQYQPYFDDLS